MIYLLYVPIYIIQGILVVFSVVLVRWCLEKIFRPSRKVLKLYLVHRLFSIPWFCLMLLHICYIYILVLFILFYVFDLSMLQARNFHSLFYSFTEYVVYSLSSFSSFFQVRFCLLLLSLLLLWTVVELVVFFTVIGGYSH